MNHLTTLDAGFLKAEDVDRHVSLAIGALAVIEGPAPDQEAFLSSLAQRLRPCTRFGQRLRLRPFDLGAPKWVDDPDFDLGRHVWRIALPRPGNEDQLFELIADLMARRLDRGRPLWEVWVIEGLADSKWAILTKLHHCMADGIAATHLLAGLSDESMSDSFASNIHTTMQSQSASVRRGGFRVNPSEALTASTAVMAGIVRAAKGASEIAAGVLSPAASSLNGPISDLRRYSAAKVPLADVEQVCRKFDVTINDIANRLPFPMTAWAVGLLMRLPQRGVVTVATNVPGPRRPLQIMGRRVLDLYPVSPIAMQLRTSVAMLSYADDLYFGILADYDVVADAGQLARGIEDAVARLVAISKRRKVTRRRGALSLVV